jgi:purine-nucleoside phosphorylase
MRAQFPFAPSPVAGPEPFDAAQAAERLAAALPRAPETLLVLGSGLSGLADVLADPTVVPFSDLPGFPTVGVAGHAGRYVCGLLEGRRVLVQAGRFHLYEGHARAIVAGTVRVARRLGVRTLLLTNAAGGIDPRLEPGSLMLIDDHLDLTFGRPLAGAVEAGEERFPDMGAPYAPELQALAERAALGLGIPLARGVYAAVAGPAYETPAEVRALARCGAHAVGMSTVPEVIVARAAGMRCLALSLITNRAAGLGGAVLAHDEVVAMGRAAEGALSRLLGRIVRDLPA